jgi:hypothetical protein
MQIVKMDNIQNQQQRENHLMDGANQCGAGYNLRKRTHADDGETPLPKRQMAPPVLTR